MSLTRSKRLARSRFGFLIFGAAATVFLVAGRGAGAIETTLEQGWSLVDEGRIAGEQYSLYERSEKGANTKSYRTESVFNASTREIFDAALRLVASPSEAPDGQTRELVRTGTDDFVVHTRIDVPLASDRDVNIHVQSWHHETSGALGLDWYATTREGPRARPGVVRIPKADGFWRFWPIGERRTRVVYQNSTDLGGSIPSWVIGPMLREEAIGQVRVLWRMLEREPHDARAGRPRAAAVSRTPGVEDR